MPRILHISDLHFGRELLPLNLWRWLIQERPWSTLNADAINALIRFVQCSENRPDVIVVTGDIVTSVALFGNPGYREAKRFLLELCRACGLAPSRRLLCVPGNHDLPWRRRLCCASESRLKHFYVFYSSLLGSGSRNAGNQLFVKMDDLKLCFYLFDSTLKGKKRLLGKSFFEGVADGYVGEDQYHSIERMHTALSPNPSSDDYYRIALIHHHIEVCPKLRSDSFVDLRLQDALKFQEFLGKLFINMVLHGHKHTPYFWREVFTRGQDRGSQLGEMYIVGAGTLSHSDVSGSPTSGKWGNSFNLIDIEHQRFVRYRRFRFSDGKIFASDTTDDGELTDNDKTVGYNLRIVDGAKTVGHQIRRHRTVVEILNNSGDAWIHKVHHGVRIVREGAQKVNSEFTFSVDTKSGRIICGIVEKCVDRIDERIDIDRSSLDFQGGSPRRACFTVPYKSALKHGDDPIDIPCAVKVEKMFCMFHEEAAGYYDTFPGNEYYTIDITYPSLEVQAEIIFPPEYPLPQRFWPVFALDGLEYNPIESDQWKLNPEQSFEILPDPQTRTITLSVKPAFYTQKFSLAWELPTRKGG